MKNDSQDYWQPWGRVARFSFSESPHEVFLFFIFLLVWAVHCISFTWDRLFLRDVVQNILPSPDREQQNGKTPLEVKWVSLLLSFCDTAWDRVGVFTLLWQCSWNLETVLQRKGHYRDSYTFNNSNTRFLHQIKFTKLLLFSLL